MTKQRGNTEFVLLSKLFISFIYLCIGGGFWFLIAFALNGGAAGSPAMNSTATIFSVVFAVVFIPIFYIAVRKLFANNDRPKANEDLTKSPESKESGLTEILNEHQQITNSNIIYSLQAIAFFFPLSMLIAVIVAYRNIDSAMGTWLETHYKWQIQTCGVYILGWISGMVLLMESDGEGVLLGVLLIGAVSIYTFYRITKGWLNLNKKMVIF